MRWLDGFEGLQSGENGAEGGRADGGVWVEADDHADAGDYVGDSAARWAEDGGYRGGVFDVALGDLKVGVEC